MPRRTWPSRSPAHLNTPARPESPSPAPHAAAIICSPPASHDTVTIYRQRTAGPWRGQVITRQDARTSPAGSGGPPSRAPLRGEHPAASSQGAGSDAPEDPAAAGHPGRAEQSTVPEMGFTCCPGVPGKPQTPRCHRPRVSVPVLIAERSQLATSAAHAVRSVWNSPFGPVRCRRT